MTQEYDTTTERKLWFSGAWGRSLPTSFLQFGPDCIACRDENVSCCPAAALSSRTGTCKQNCFLAESQQPFMHMKPFTAKARNPLKGDSASTKTV